LAGGEGVKFGMQLFLHGNMGIWNIISFKEENLKLLELSCTSRETFEHIDQFMFIGIPLPPLADPRLILSRKTGTDGCIGR